jgi:flagellar basal-body rod protein FlgC
MIISSRASMSALAAASKDMSVRASNIANQRTSAPIDKVEISAAARSAAANADDGGESVFRPSEVSNVSVAGGGVQAVVREKTPSHHIVHTPDNPKANADGMVAMPNVNITNELVGMSQARTMFEANLAMVRAADEMAGTLLDSRF